MTTDNEWAGRRGGPHRPSSPPPLTTQDTSTITQSHTQVITGHPHITEHPTRPARGAARSARAVLGRHPPAARTSVPAARSLSHPWRPLRHGRGEQLRLGRSDPRGARCGSAQSVIIACTLYPYFKNKYCFVPNKVHFSLGAIGSLTHPLPARPAVMYTPRVRCRSQLRPGLLRRRPTATSHHQTSRSGRDRGPETHAGPTVRRHCLSVCEPAPLGRRRPYQSTRSIGARR